MARVRRKRKKIFQVIAPDIFDNAEVGYIISSGYVVGRTIEVPLINLTGFPLHNYINCKLKIHYTEGDKAYTIYYGHQYFREYIQALFIRGTSYVDIYRDVEVKEGIRYRILAGVYTTKRINTSRKRAIRRRVFSILDKYNGRGNNEFLKAAIYGVIDTEIGSVARKIYPIRWVGIQKMKVVKL